MINFRKLYKILLKLMSINVYAGTQVQVYGNPTKLPSAVDFYVLSNEDIGFIATLGTGTNDSFLFALPYPASIDLFDETIVVHKIEFLYHNEPSTGVTTSALLAYISYLNRAFTATFRGTPADADDEALKAQFAGPLFFGEKGTNIVASAAAEGSQREESIVDAEYWPPVPLDLFIPIFVQLVGQAHTHTLTTNAKADASFTFVERVYMRIWFTIRRLTSAEKNARAVGQRFIQLDS